MLLDKELITEAIVDNLLSWRHSGFSVHGAVRVEDRQGAVRLARFHEKVPRCQVPTWRPGYRAIPEASEPCFHPHSR